MISSDKIGLLILRMSNGSKIITYRQEHPHQTLAEIGSYFQVSRQYVHRVLKTNGVPTLRAKKKKFKYCLVCGQATPRQRMICPGKCSFNYYNIKVNCAFCRIPFYRKRGQIINKYDRGYNKIYCGRQCYYRGKRDDIN